MKIILRTITNLLIIGLLVIFFQNYLIFPGAIFSLFNFGERENIPSKIQVNYIKSNKNKIESWYLAGAKGRGYSGYNIIFFHGNNDSIVNIYPIQEWYANQGFSVLTFSYRGYGYSSGIPTSDALKIDSEFIWEFVKNNYGFKNTNTYFIAHSIGTGVATSLAEVVQPKGIVLLAPYSKLTEVVKDHPVFKYFKSFLWNEFDNETSLEKINSCILILHGEKDNIISVNHSKKLARFIKKPCDKIVFEPKEDHLSIVDMSLNSTLSWINEFNLGE